MQGATPARVRSARCQVTEMQRWWQAGSDADMRCTGAFSSFQPGVSLQAKPSLAFGNPDPVQQGLAQPSTVQCLCSGESENLWTRCRDGGRLVQQCGHAVRRCLFKPPAKCEPPSEAKPSLRQVLVQSSKVLRNLQQFNASGP
uniref:Uncharacterized protein n=1 Tax=Fagus sylvatica TaxID=28930 RepID=A0A2N9EYB7_FAGSY